MSIETRAHERVYLGEIIRHHLWATDRLIAFVRTLPAQMLHLTAPGTFGRLGITLVHVVKADEHYLALMTGERRSPPLPPLSEIRDVDLADLAGRAVSSARHFSDVLEALPDPSARPADAEGLTTAELVVQAVHHANEHRAQIGTILGANGIVAPDVSGWAFGRREHRA